MSAAIPTKAVIMYVFCQRYAELYLGFYDHDRSGVWRGGRKNGRGDQCGAGFCRGCSIALHYDDRCDGVVGWTDGDCTEVRADRQIDTGDTAFYQVSLPTDSGGTSGQRVYCD